MPPQQSPLSNENKSNTYFISGIKWINRIKAKKEITTRVPEFGKISVNVTETENHSFLL